MQISKLKQLAFSKVYDGSQSDLPSELDLWLQSCAGAVKQVITYNKKNIQKYEGFFDLLPIINGAVNIRNGVIFFDIAPENRFYFKQRFLIKDQIKQLIPWRKGPYNLFGIPIDSEWNCSLKWNRLTSKIPTLKNDIIMDVGSGNGYFAWRMREAGAKFVVCLEPSFLSFIQFHFLNHFADDVKIRFLPMTLEDSPKRQCLFDKVFMMGTLYHSKTPFEHLKIATRFLKDGGFLILETLIFDSNESSLFVPKENYARMPNVWHLPSFLAIKSWLVTLGFSEIELVSVDTTSIAEQRVTEHMPFKSLDDGLCNGNDNFTIELYPRPRRGIIIAQRTRADVALN